MPLKRNRDCEKICTKKEFVWKLRRLADALERGKAVRMQVGGKRISIPKSASCSVEHEQEGDRQELEFQLKW